MIAKYIENFNPTGDSRMSIGSTIKRLRQEKKITQEELAECLGITSKAVSQWECDRTDPNISQIPALCRFFDVSSDELLGINVDQKNAQRDALLDEDYQLAKNGYINESWEHLHNALKQFPGDYRIMEAIIICSDFIVNNACEANYKETIKEECKTYCDRILEGCTIDAIRYTAIDYLCRYYAEHGDVDQASAMANKMPFLSQSKNFLLANIHEGSTRKYLNQRLNYDLLQFVINRIPRNHRLDSGELLYSEQELTVLRDKCVSILHFMFEDGDFGFYHVVLSELHLEQACFFANYADEASVLNHIEQAIDHAIKFLQYMRKDKLTHSSLLFKGMQDCPDGVMLSESDNIALQISKKMDSGIFSFINNKTQLDALKAKICRYAEKNKLE